MSKILILTPQFPFPPNQGTTIRNFNLIAGLSRRHELHLLSFGDADQCRTTPLHALCKSVQVVEPSRRSSSQRVKGLLLSRLPDMALRLPSGHFRAALTKTLDRLDPDVLEVEGIELAQYLLQVSTRRRGARRPWLVFDDHNAEYVLQRRAFETDLRSLDPRRWIAAAYSLVQWHRLRRYERAACLAADRVVAVSQADAQALQHLAPTLAPLVVPNGVDARLYAEGVEPLPDLPMRGGHGASRTGLVFTGKMDFRPNVDAVLWFAQDVLPLIQREWPDVHFWVVGKNPHPRLAPLAANPAVTLTGMVEDVRPYIAAAAVYVVPLRIGGGTRLKVLEAMAMSKAIVSTTLGCEGFELLPGRDVVTADLASEFAGAVAALLRDPERCETLGLAARRVAETKYDWSIIVPLLEQAFVA